MHKNQLRLLGIAIAFMLPAMAMAAPPEPASGITARIEDDGKVHVRWDAIENQARARVYWSYISILENNGEYDDFAVSEGDATEYVIEEAPAVDTLFVSVILENTDGEQSPFFIEEASIEMPKNVPASSAATQEQSSSSAEAASSIAVQESSSSAMPQVASASSAASVANDGKFHLLSAVPGSPTQIVLTFSHPVVLNVADAARAFTVVTSDGRVLPLLRIEILSNQVTLTTDTQERGVAYVATAGSVVQGVQTVDGQQIPMQLANLIESATFTGHAFGREPIVPVDNKGFTLQATSIGGGLFRIETQLTGLPHDDLVRYDVYQSIDGGRTFAGPQSIDAKTPSIRVEGVAEGAFVMTLQPIAADGSARSALTASVMLGSGTPLPSASTSSSSTPAAASSSSWSMSSDVTHSPSTNLPGAGAGILTILGTGSAWAMMRIRRRKTVA